MTTNHTTECDAAAASGGPRAYGIAEHYAMAVKRIAELEKQKRDLEHTVEVLRIENSRLWGQVAK